MRTKDFNDGLRNHSNWQEALAFHYFALKILPTEKMIQMWNGENEIFYFQTNNFFIELISSNLSLCQVSERKV